MEQNLTALVKVLSERQQIAERQLGELGAVVKALEARIAELSRPAAPLAAAPPARAAQPAPVTRKAEISPEILVMLAAAATAYMGKEVRVRSARMLQSPYEIINPWAQQGRAFIQASHNARLTR